MLSTPGLHGAPVTKALIISSVALTIAWSMFHGPIITYNLIQTSTPLLSILYSLLSFVLYPLGGLLLLSTPLLYIGRLSERLLGSRRFSGLLLVANILSFILHFFSIHYSSLIHSSSIFIPSSSTPLFLCGGLFSSVLVAFVSVPAFVNRKILKVVTINEKFFGLVVMVQLIIAFPPFSVVSFLSALIVSFLTVKSSVFRRFLDLFVPKLLCRWSLFLLLPLLTSRQAPRQSVSSAVLRSFPEGLPSVPPQSTVPQSTVPPSETLISLLTDMGFSRDESVRSLQRSRNNIEGAVALMTENQ
ncbi:hypothetical protein RCL1_007330 [Eukaryota sp. TZLM3-RCL]